MIKNYKKTLYKTKKYGKIQVTQNTLNRSVKIMDIFRHIFVETHKNYKINSKKLNLVTYFTKKIVVLAVGVSLLFTVGQSLASWTTFGAPTEASEPASVAPLSDSAGSPWGTPPAGSTLNEIWVNGSNEDMLTTNSIWSDEGKYDGTFYNNMLQEYIKDGSYSTEETALEIGTAAEFAAFAKYVNEGNNFANKFVRLTSDIDLGGSGLNIAYLDNGNGTYNINITGTIENAWEAIGKTAGEAFSGTFDGGMYSISNMYTYGGGLFSFLNGACLKNIVIQGNSLATNYIGGVGGLANYSCGKTNTTIENCCNAANVYGLSPYGFSCSGLLSEAGSGGTIKINNCCNLGDVYARNGDTSGILSYGSNLAGSVVKNCFSSSRLGASSSAPYHNTSGIAYVAQAYLSSGAFSNCYYNKDLPGNICAIHWKSDESAGTNVKGLTTAQMQGDAARTNMPGIADAVKDNGTPLWVFIEGEYPHFGIEEIEIYKRNLDITADDTYVLQREAIPDPLTYTVTDSDTNEVLTGDILGVCLTGKLAHDAPSTPELTSYSITQGTLASKNTENAKIKNFTNGILKIFTDVFSINSKNITNNEQIKLSLNPTSGSYTGSAHSPTVTVTDSEITVGGNAKTLAITTDYKISKPTDMTTVGDKTITVTGAGNYTGSKNATYTITASTENIAVTLSPTTFTYNGTSQKPTVTVKDGNTTLTEGANNDYTVTWPEDTISAGIKEVTVTLNEGKYGKNQAKTASYKIVIDATYGDKIGDKLEYGNSLKSMLGEPKFADGSSIPGEWDWSRRLYGDQHGKNTFVGNVTAEGETRTFTVEFYPSTEQGKTHLTSIGKASEIKGENGQVIATAYLETAIPFTVAKKALTVTADNKTQVYGEAEVELTKTVSGLVGSDTLTGSLKINKTANFPNVGTYDIVQDTAFSNSNYNITFNNGTYTINKKDVTVTATAASKTFGESDPTSFAYTNTALVGTETLSGALARAAGENAGEYNITQGTLTNANNPNYNITFVSAKFTINKKSLTATGMTVSLDSSSGTYTDSPHNPTITVKDGTSILTKDTHYTITLPSDMTNVGNKTITITGNGNYNGTVTKIYTISQEDGTTSVIISPETTDMNGIVWLLEESDGTSAWYGIDNRANTFVSGSRFYVQWLNTREHPEAFADIDEETRQQVEENRGWLFRIGVIAPDGTRYSTLPTPVNVYVQIGDDWDKDDLRGFYIQAGEDESVEVTYVEGMPYPEGFDEFGVMKLRHFSPYFIYDELTEAEKAALGSSKKDEPVLTTETDVRGEQTQVIVRDPAGILPSGTKVIAVVDYIDDIFKIWLVDECGNSLPMPLSAPVEVSVEIPDGIDKDVFKDRLSKAGENGHLNKFGKKWYVTITSNYFPIKIYLGELTDEEKAKTNKGNESIEQPKSRQEENISKGLIHEASASEGDNSNNNAPGNEKAGQWWSNLSPQQIAYVSTGGFMLLLIFLMFIIAAKRKKKNNKQ